MSTCIDHGRRPGRIDYATTTTKARKTIGRHVLALIEATGEQPNGRQCLHKCDNPRCINPEHLYWGNISSNMKDAYARGRHRKAGAKLTEDQVKKIRYEETGTLSDIARKYRVSHQNVWMIKERLTWKSI